MIKKYQTYKYNQQCKKNETERNQSIQEIHTLNIKYPDLHPYQLLNKYVGKGVYKDIRAKQVQSEIMALYDRVASEKPEIVCEIGTFKGGTLYLWTQAAADDALIISMDLPPGLKNKFTPDRQSFYHSFSKKKQFVCCLPGNSHDNDTKEKLKTILGGRRIDFLFIDGDHSYEGVRMDFEMYSTMVKNGGLIAFHDILPRKGLENIQVYRLWRELIHQYEYCEYIDKERKKIGIGLIVWNNQSKTNIF